MQDIISTLKNALQQAEAGLEVAVGRLAKDGTERGDFKPSEVLALACVREALAMPVTCLHQIQEPAPVPAAQPSMTAAFFAARGALQHLKEGGKPTELLLNEAIAAIDSVAISEAAPAAVAVPDGWQLVPMEGTEEMARAFRAESTPALFYMTTIQCADFQERYRVMLGATPALAATPAAPAAAAPVVLPEPDAVISEVMGLVESYADAVASDMELQYEALEISIKSKLRALLATATGLPAQAVPLKLIEAINTACNGNAWQGDALVTDLLEPACRAIANLAPQAQADARDAEDAALIEWLSSQYLAADFHWGEPKTPVLVIEIPATASVCGDFRTDVRAAIAIAAAKGEQQ